jgi:hypothetical protein
VEVRLAGMTVDQKADNKRRQPRLKQELERRWEGGLLDLNERKEQVVLVLVSRMDVLRKMLEDWGQEMLQGGGVWTYKYLFCI